jgi:hypothetical protein
MKNGEHQSIPWFWCIHSSSPLEVATTIMAEARITYHGVGKRYGKLWALRKVDCAFHAGEVVMLIGPNASGKTTLIKSLLGLVSPTEGRITVNGQVIGSDPGLPQGHRLHAADLAVPGHAHHRPVVGDDGRHPRAAC